jgi:hypothetical protein
MFTDADKMVAATLAAAVMPNGKAPSEVAAVQLYARIVVALEANGLIGAFGTKEAEAAGASQSAYQQSVYNTSEFWKGVSQARPVTIDV